MINMKIYLDFPSKGIYFIKLQGLCFHDYLKIFFFQMDTNKNTEWHIISMLILG